MTTSKAPGRSSRGFFANKVGQLPYGIEILDNDLRLRDFKAKFGLYERYQLHDPHRINHSGFEEGVLIANEGVFGVIQVCKYELPYFVFDFHKCVGIGFWLRES